MAEIWMALAAMLCAGFHPQVDPLPPVQPSREAAGRDVEWKEGQVLRVRVPIASPTHQLMTTIAFPEEGVEAAITGWGEGEITAIQKRGLLFLRLSKKSEGQLNVIGGSGTHYLLYLQGTEGTGASDYDTYLRIRKLAERAAEPRPRPGERRPVRSLELVQAMRLGLRPEGGRILRAGRELAFESAAVTIRLLYVYDTAVYSGHVYEIVSRSAERQAVDASRFRSKDARLVLSALRENVLEPGASTRLYLVFWKD